MDLYKHIKRAYRNTCITYQKLYAHAKRLKRIKLVIADFLNNLNKLPCTCGCYNTKEINYDYMDNLLCEYIIVCDKCEKVLGYYTYGNYNIIETYTELWSTIIAEKVNIVTWYLYRRFK